MDIEEEYLFITILFHVEGHMGRFSTTLTIFGYISCAIYFSPNLHGIFSGVWF
jgi:hypothetical protein